MDMTTYNRETFIKLANKGWNNEISLFHNFLTALKINLNDINIT